jgi:hypothetical protein
MSRTCRKLQESSWRKREIVRTTLRHARIVTDPTILAYLNAEVRKRPILPAPRSHVRR